MRDIVLVYVSKSGNTRLIAEAIAEGARAMDLTADVVDLCEIDNRDVLDAEVIAIGSPTYEHGMLQPIEKLLDGLERSDCEGKPGIAFGSYGWSGEAPLLIARRMRELGFIVLDPVMRIQYTPHEKDIDACHLLGQGTAKKLKNIKRQS
jgi:flavodoxin I